MENVVERLKEYRYQIDLKKRFDYSFDIAENLFDPSEISELSDNDNPFEQNVKLKWILNKKYQTSLYSTTIDFWIISQPLKIHDSVDNQLVNIYNAWLNLQANVYLS